MPSRRSAIVTFTAVCSGLIVITAAGLSLKRPARERWYISRLTSRDAATRNEAAERLASMGSVKAIPQLVSAFSATAPSPTAESEPDPFAQMTALYAQKVSGAALVSSLRVTARTADGRVVTRPSRTSVRRRAQLATLQNRSTAIDLRIANLTEVVLERSTHGALVKIAKASTDAALPRLTPALESGDWKSRWLAVHVLGELSGEEVDQLILTATRDGNEHVRHAASAALARRAGSGQSRIPGALQLPVRRRGF